MRIHTTQEFLQLFPQFEGEGCEILARLSNNMRAWAELHQEGKNLDLNICFHIQYEEKMTNVQVRSCQIQANLWPDIASHKHTTILTQMFAVFDPHCLGDVAVGDTSYIIDAAVLRQALGSVKTKVGMQKPSREALAKRSALDIAQHISDQSEASCARDARKM